MGRLNIPKYEQAILFFLHACDNRHLGKTKLMKLLYYLDFNHFERYGESITGDEYIRKPFGPVPESAEFVLGLMEAHGLIRHEPQPVGPHRQDRYVPNTNADLSVFDLIEAETVRLVAERWKDVPLREIVDATHQEAPWQAVGDNEHIPYEYARQRGAGDRPKIITLSAIERDRLIRSVISSEALEGVYISYDEAERLLDKVLAEPIANIG